MGGGKSTWSKHNWGKWPVETPATLLYFRGRGQSLVRPFFKCGMAEDLIGLIGHLDAGRGARRVVPREVRGGDTCCTENASADMYPFPPYPPPPLIPRILTFYKRHDGLKPFSCPAKPPGSSAPRQPPPSLTPYRPRKPRGWQILIVPRRAT